MREFGSEYPSTILPDGYFDSLPKFGCCTWLRSGREALFLLAKSIKSCLTSEPCIFMPAYCCRSMSAPFAKAGWEVVYYRLNEDLTVDIPYLVGLLHQTSPSAVLLMNYYGSTSTDRAVAEIKKYSQECVCIEDFSHCTFSFPYIFNTDIDYYVSSIRKSVGIPDGAIVIGKKHLDIGLIRSEVTNLTILRQDAQNAKVHYAYSKNEEEKEFFLDMLHKGEDILNMFNEVNGISSVSKRVLSLINGAEIRFARKTNMKHLLSLLQNKVRIISGIERCLEGSPFSLPILVEDRDCIQKQLASEGVYAPVLWPICEEARAVCTHSAKMADCMLSIPIDQRYDYDDIEQIASIVLKYCSYK